MGTSGVRATVPRRTGPGNVAMGWEDASCPPPKIRGTRNPLSTPATSARPSLRSVPGYRNTPVRVLRSVSGPPRRVAGILRRGFGMPDTPVHFLRSVSTTPGRVAGTLQRSWGLPRSIPDRGIASKISVLSEHGPPSPVVYRGFPITGHGYNRHDRSSSDGLSILLWVLHIRPTTGVPVFHFSFFPGRTSRRLQSTAVSALWSGGRRTGVECFSTLATAGKPVTGGVPPTPP